MRVLILHVSDSGCDKTTTIDQLPFGCDACDKKFCEEECLTIHRNNAHNSKNLSYIIRPVYKYTIFVDTMIHAIFKRGNFSECDECGMRCATRADLNEHVNLHREFDVKEDENKLSGIYMIHDLFQLFIALP